MRRGELIQAPRFFHRAPHQFVGRVGAFRKGDAQQTVGRFDARHAVYRCDLGVWRRPLEAEEHHAAALELFQRGNRVVEHRGAVMQDLHAVTHAFDFRQDVRRQDHAAVAAEFADQLADFADLVGVEPDRRFVEYHDVGAVHDRLRDADALLITFGQRADQFFGDIGKAAARQRVVDR